MGLDIKGAFDRVDRDLLLQALIKKGVPDWLVTLVWSFFPIAAPFCGCPVTHPRSTSTGSTSVYLKGVPYRLFSSSSLHLASSRTSRRLTPNFAPKSTHSPTSMTPTY
ncbi:hypothetical protein BU26DRAFT_593188 [Trematosphaeria pertusa]|uniref:Reverse transcriptase domain-containing protein n=1 Tax=Trematosphaeria pertusa TaxID=390896 RepID=A0A6A6IGU0_9PLEO|nr:uncharacterized protein BU26DRAFT_593188 [Trematosphaeria pertusa]KAF2249804.1 hypothetical protein BU26DRAFT_593188 [Trematosphaeria pertusa]